MSWLQKRPQISNPSQYYTVGLSKTILIVGLGNPGAKYTDNRHNIGYKCVESFTDSLEEFDKWTLKKDLKCHIRTAQLGDSRVLVAKPTTYMNNSGEAVQALVNFYKIDVHSMLIVHDELDINFGHIRTRIGGSDAGHNGIKSISQSLSDPGYGRVRIGIGPKKPLSIDSKDFVLQNFPKDQADLLSDLLRETTAILSEYIYGKSELPIETRSFIY